MPKQYGADHAEIKEQARKAEARRIHLEGLAKKHNDIQ